MTLGHIAKMIRAAGLPFTAARNLILFRRLKSPIPPAPNWITEAINAASILLPPVALMKPGGLELPGLVALVGIAKALRTSSILEIGTATGLTSWALAMNLPDATIFTLDLPPDISPSMRVGRADHPLTPGEAPRVFTGTPQESQVRQLFGDSATFDFGEVSQCDLVLIDGAHSGEYVEHDSQVARHLVGAAGAIVWDDYWYLAPGVVRYLDRDHPPGMYRLPNTRLVVWFSDSALAMIRDRGRSPDPPG